MNDADSVTIKESDLKWLLYWAEIGIMQSIDADWHDDIRDGMDVTEHRNSVVARIQKLSTECPRYHPLYYWQ